MFPNVSKKFPIHIFAIVEENTNLGLDYTNTH